MAGARPARATPSGWARPMRRGSSVSYIQSLYWEFGSGCVLPRTGVLMQNRGASFSLDPRCAERARARPAAVPHAQSGARRAQRRPRHGLRHHGRRRPAADAGRDSSRAMCCYRQPLDEAIDAPRWLLGRTWGSTHHQPADGIPLRRQPDRPAACRPATTSRCCRTPIPTPWATPARWCCIPTARWKARTIRAPTAARRVS